MIEIVLLTAITGIVGVGIYLMRETDKFVEEQNILTGESIVRPIGETEKNIAIGNIPIMVKSKYCTTSVKNDLLGECKYDPGGYFIVNGNEKSIVAQEKIADNKPYTFKVNKINNKTICMAEIKSVSEKMFSIPKNFSLKFPLNFRY